MEDKTPLERELVSALVDGELRGEDFARVLAGLQESGEGLSTWHAYHVAGEAMRGAASPVGRDDLAFVLRLRERMASVAVGPHANALAGETGRPASAGGAAVSGATLIMPGRAGQESANDANTRWKLVAGFASLAAVAAIGWQVYGLDAVGRQSMPLAAGPPAGQVAAGIGAQAGSGSGAESPVMLRDPRLDELLAAHKQMGGTSALQMPAGFLRNATFETTGR